MGIKNIMGIRGKIIGVYQWLYYNITKILCITINAHLVLDFDFTQHPQLVLHTGVEQTGYEACTLTCVPTVLSNGNF